MIVVSDTTPLISLMKINQLHLVKDLYGEIVIPEAVYNELTTNEKFSKEATEIMTSNFIRKVVISDSKEVAMIQKYSGLDLGESEAIAYSEEVGADLLMMDEVRGRAVAKQIGLTIIGTLGILRHAYEHNLLSRDEVIKCVTDLKENHRHIGDDLIAIFIDSLD